MKNLTEIYIEKSQRTGRYADTAENRRLHRVGQPYKKRESAEVDPESLIKYENLPTKVEDMGRIFSQRAIAPFIYTDNGNADLNREGKKGFTTWVGFQHVVRGRQPVDKSKMLKYIAAHAKKDFVRAVNEKTGGNFKESDIKLDDRWGSTDMFRMYIDTSKLSKKTNGNDKSSNKSTFTSDEASTKQSQEAKALPKQENSLPSEGVSPQKAVENFTRVKFDDMPNSSKVNLKKYLSVKLKADVDTRVADVTKGASKSELERLNAQSTKTFNDTFDVMSKSGRAAQLYYTMKVRDLLARK